MAESFLKICEREIIDKVNDGLSLNVVLENGVEATPDVELNVTHLNNDGWKGYPHFQFNGYYGTSFKVDVILKDNEYYYTSLWNLNMKSIDYLHNLYVQAKKIYVVSKALDVPNGWYMITDIKKKQKYKNQTIWSMEFTYFRSLTVISYKNNNMTISQAKKRVKNKSSSSTNNQLKKCKVEQMKLNKVNICCYRLNAKLFKLGYISSKTWKAMAKKKQTNKFTKETSNALKKFQKKYKVTDKNLAHHLIVSGQLDKKTLNALIKM